MLDALDISGYLIRLAGCREQESLTNLKIQKLLYYAQGHALGLWSRILFPERILAWQLGPVVVEVYREYERFGSSSIPIPQDFDLSKFDTDTISLLEDVFGRYGNYSAAQLVDMTHAESPWRKARINSEISVKSMQDFFSRRPL
jgi:uncharacterized phage-associated protein